MATKLKNKVATCRVINKHSAFDESKYIYSDKFQPWNGKDASTIHTTPELVGALRKDDKLDIDARVLALKEGKLGYQRLNKKAFLEAWDKNRNRRFKEATDYFGYDLDPGSNLYGREAIPLLGGPFYKQLYYYDYIRMHNLSFYAYHHDPIARAIVQIIRDFTLGRGFRVDCEDPRDQVIWKSFEEANDLQTMMDSLALELSIYGETMVWWLPNHDTKIQYRIQPGQEAPKGLIPRVRLIDPSAIWEVVTFPEDITRVLYYQWVAPTQYQTYTGSDAGSSVPGSKFIYQQVPAAQVQHYKINSVSNEKRGRSDLFPVLGYLKRLRDAVNYSLVSMQKQSAWSIDTAIDGASEDIDQYISDLNNQPAMPDAGSEFVHSNKVTRTFLANSAGRGGQQEAFEWCWSMIAAGTGIPVSYFGTHMSGGQTRASAMIATEPVAKKFQMRQSVYERILLGMTKKLGIKGKVEVTFPELIVQDRSAKLKDLALAEASKWLSKERSAEIFSKEMHITDFNWEDEKQKIQAESEEQGGSPLTAPASLIGPAASAMSKIEQPSSSAVTQQDRKAVADNERAGNA